MGALEIASLIQAAVGITCKVIQIIQDDTGGITIIEYAKGTHDINVGTLGKIDGWLAAKATVPTT